MENMAMPPDHTKSKEELLAELKAARQEIAGLREVDAERKGAGEARETGSDLPVGDPHYLEEEFYRLVKNDPKIIHFLEAGSLDGIWYWDLENPDHVWMSSRFWELFGYKASQKEHLTSEWQDMLFQEDLKTAIDNFQKHCTDENHPYDQILRYRHKNGSTVWVRCRGVALRDASGKPVRMLGAHNDITELKRSEEALKRSETRYALAQRAANIGSWEWDVLTGDLYWSDRIEPLFGFGPGQFGGTYEAFLDCVHPEDRQLVIDSVDASLEGKKDYFVEHRIVRPDSQVRWLTESGDVHRDDEGLPVRMYGVVQDVTERKELEQLREDVERLMRHDLKSPLNGVIGLPQIMLDDENLTPQQVERLTLIQETGYRMLNHINLSLDLYKMETGAFEYEPGLVESAGLLKRLLHDLGLKAGNKGVKLEALVKGAPSDKAESILFQADEPLCYTMLANLLDNAVDASPMGERITLRLEEEPDAVAFSVHNVGPVPKAIRDTFFGKYATHGKTKGTGLGTYSAKLIAEAQGGSIRMETSRQEGTTVTIRLPKE